MSAEPKRQLIKQLRGDTEARGLIGAACARDQKHGDGDTMDLCLFVYDETRKHYEAQLRAAQAERDALGLTLEAALEREIYAGREGVALRAERDALFEQARIVLYDPVDTLAYPIEHNPYVIEKATRSPMTKDSILRTISARIASREKP